MQIFVSPGSVDEAEMICRAIVMDVWTSESNAHAPKCRTSMKQSAIKVLVISTAVAALTLLLRADDSIQPNKPRSAPSLRLFLEGLVYKDLVAGESTNQNFGLLCLGTDQNQTYLTSLFTNRVPRIESGTNNIVILKYGLIDRITGRPAIFFWADLESLTNNIATIDAGSDTGRRGFISFSYQLRAKGTNWVIVKRRIVAVS